MRLAKRNGVMPKVGMQLEEMRMRDRDGGGLISCS